jgi:hypothetical protein
MPFRGKALKKGREQWEENVKEKGIKSKKVKRKKENGN